ASEQRYRLLVENAPLGVLSIDRGGRIVDLNSKLVEMLGSPSAEATRAINLLTFAPLVESGIAADFKRCLETGEPIVSEHPYRSRWGVEVQVRYHLQPTRDADGLVNGVHAIVEDVGAIRQAELEKRRLEDQLREAQKMEAIGQLAGGVAHDMNNILGTVLGLASVLQVELAGDDSVAAELQAIVAACKKGRDLTRDLLGFARRGKYRRQRVALNELAAEVKLLLERTVSKMIEIRTDLEPSLDDIEGDPGQLNQALMNICLNAVDAIRGDGAITIRTRNLDRAAPGPEIGSGPHVELSVIDTGVGLDPETLDHVFEPFFTTKPPGKGTGLGLAMVYGTVRNHGGSVEMESAPGCGTTVTILLPALRGGPREVSAPALEPVAPRQAAGTALLVDDEAGFREAGSRMLELLGFKVLTAAHGAEAVRLFRERHGVINLVVLDMIMPVMDGVETFDRLRAIDAGVPVLLASGYAQETKADDLLGRGAAGFLQKPFDVEALARELSRLP
ncbi:MAG: hybrid sensor histidine kinase/response regulator, partial [Acidobacteriota bacterium]